MPACQSARGKQARHHAAPALASLAHLDDKSRPFTRFITPFPSCLSCSRQQHLTPDRTTTCAPTASRPAPPNPVQLHPGSPLTPKPYRTEAAISPKSFLTQRSGPIATFPFHRRAVSVSRVRIVAQTDLLSHGHALFSHDFPSLRASGTVCIHQPYHKHVVACFEARRRLSTLQIAPLSLRTET